MLNMCISIILLAICHFKLFPVTNENKESINSAWLMLMVNISDGFLMNTNVIKKKNMSLIVDGIGGDSGSVSERIIITKRKMLKLCDMVD